jgi:DNA-binding NtrC family response regulator
MTHTLVIDDEPAICRCFETLLGSLDSEVTVTASAEEALTLVRQHTYDVIVMDVRLPGMDGLTAMPKLRESSDAPIVIITAHGDLSTAISAVKEGAFEYLPKPFHLDQITQVLKRAIEHARTATCRTEPHAAAIGRSDFVGNSLPMQQLFRQIALAAQHDAPVLITGESGTGKELVAHAIHIHSRRSTRPIVPVHLASVNSGLMERELFGHSAGAFTGAETAQSGLLQRANGGTLFLDEIGEAPMAVQIKLLRAVECGDFYRVGSSAPECSDFRTIAATNRPITYLRSSDMFRPDLFYRLSTIHIHVPPLRERTDDIPLLAQHFLNQVSNGQHRSFTADALQLLTDRTYAGNVRELRNIVVSAARQTPAGQIPLDVIPARESGQNEPSDAGGDLRAAAREWARQALADSELLLLQKATQIVETEVISAVLEETSNNRSAAAQRLGIHRETLRDKLVRRDDSGD